MTPGVRSAIRTRVEHARPEPGAFHDPAHIELSRRIAIEDRAVLLKEVDRLRAALEHLASPDGAECEYDTPAALASTIAAYAREVLSV